MESSKLDDRLTTLAAAFAATLNDRPPHGRAGKATRDTLFLTQFDVTYLPRMTIVAAILSVAAVLGMSRLMSRLGPAWLVPRIYLASSLVFALEWPAMKFNPEIIAVALYLHITVLGAILISGFSDQGCFHRRPVPPSAPATAAQSRPAGGSHGRPVPERVALL